MNSRIEQLKIEIGAISEVVKMMYDAYIDQGFTKRDALTLAGKYIEKKKKK